MRKNNDEFYNELQFSRHANGHINPQIGQPQRLCEVFQAQYKTMKPYLAFRLIAKR